MTIAYLALGSNIGDRLGNLRRACELLQSRGIEILARSKIYETQSVEGGGPDDFLNAALRVQTNFSARGLLQILQQIESEIGRPMPPRHGPRLIDIDLLFFGDEKIDEPDLKIPHPRMLQRIFVLRPLCDVLESGWLRQTDENWN